MKPCNRAPWGALETFMKMNHRLLFTGILATCPCLAVAAPGINAHGCEWGLGSGPMVFVRDFGTLYIPRDAPLGAVIGQARTEGFDNQSGGQVQCWNFGGPTVTFDTQAVTSLAPPPPIASPPYALDRLLQTNVPGIAVQIEYQTPFNSASAFLPVDGRPPIVPFTAVMNQQTIAFPVVYSAGFSYMTMVKVGPIPAGAHQITPNVLFTGSFTDIPRALTYAVSGTVVQAQCEIGAGTPSYIDLGDWNTSHFTGPGTTTADVPFALELERCADDPANGATDIYVQFDPQRTSSPVIGPNGVFSLTQASTAAGVGIQVARGDGSPMPLNSVVQMQRLPGSGFTRLEFLARFYQTGTPEQVQAGTAEGFLGFTISYL